MFRAMQQSGRDPHLQPRLHTRSTNGAMTKYVQVCRSCTGLPEGRGETHPATCYCLKEMEKTQSAQPVHILTICLIYVHTCTHVWYILRSASLKAASLWQGVITQNSNKYLISRAWNFVDNISRCSKCPSSYTWVFPSFTVTTMHEKCTSFWK